MRTVNPRFLLLINILVFCFSTSVFSQDRVVDNAGLLSPQERADLSAMIASMASRYDFDLVILTENDIGYSGAMGYADDFFDNNGYGLGRDRDGCLFLQVTGTREYWFSTSGRGIKIMNSTAGAKLEADTVKYLREGNPYGAYRAFLLAWEEFLDLDARGRSYNIIHQHNLIFLFGSWLLAFLIGVIIVHKWKKEMDTALPQTQAANYVVAGSLAFKEKKDSFLYSRVTKVKRQTQQSSGGGIHTSSSGRSHGGRGGRY